MGILDDDRSQAPSVAEDEATAPTENDQDTIDPREEQQDIWARTEGYTPLSDIQYSSLVVSMGPSDGEDSDDGDNHDEQDGENSNAGEIRAAHGVFFVNPNAFSGTDSIDEGDSSKVVAVEDVASGNSQHLDEVNSLNDFTDFDKIASKALSLLHEEYERTLKGEQRPPSWQDESRRTDDSDLKQAKKDAERSGEIDDDTKIIAAGFNERKKTVQKHGFIAEWDILPAPTAKSPPAASTPSSLTVVDTNAVKKVVQALSAKPDNHFQQKFAAWQQRQQSLPATHDLIPATPYKAFKRSSQKAKQATASLSRSATLAEALIRLKEHGLLRKKEVSTLLLDIVGVDHVECESVERVQNTFRPIIRWIGAWKNCQYQKVHIRLIGRDLSTASLPQSSIDLLTPTIPTLLQSAFATCHSAVYHEWLSQLSENDSSSGGDDSHRLAIAYNAGIWGYNEWMPTIQYLAERSDAAIPFIITAYTLEECQEDMEVVQATVDTKGMGKVLWEAQPNPFGSRMVRETKSSASEYRENSAWQAWLLGGSS